MKTKPKKRPGRPPIHGETLKQVTATITADQEDKAIRVGEGNFSKGVRVCIEEAEEVEED